MIRITSDIHFNHKGIIHYCNRPFGSIEEMNDYVIEAWHSTVGKHDDVYVVGDFGFSSAARPLDQIFNRLPGRKHLIIGNHDEQNPKVLSLPWTSVQYYLKLRHEGKRAILSHYPMETWDGAHKGYIHLHGHSHGGLKRQVNHRFDVGVDVEGYAPVALVEFFARAEEQGGYVPVDHHGEGSYVD